MAKKKDVCIVDWNTGGSFPTSFWADWDGKKVVFGGDWRDVPDMPAKREPTQKRVYAWAHKHGGLKIGVPSSLSAAHQKQDWKPVSIYSTFMRSAAEELVAGMRDRYPGIDWTIEERSRSIREEPYVEHTYHLVVPRWQVAQGKRVIKAYTRGGR